MIEQRLEGRASDFLAKHKVDSLPVPVEDLAEAEGIQIVRSQAEATESGFLLRANGMAIIGLNSRNTRRRQRFTIAHELGHWLLHEGRPLIVDHTVRMNKRDAVASAGTDHEEIQANAFAAALLMPVSAIQHSVEREISLQIPSRDQLTSRLADEFDVSHEAMSIRLINLGIYTA